MQSQQRGIDARKFIESRAFAAQSHWLFANGLVVHLEQL
jgi:hypothetical protein